MQVYKSTHSDLQKHETVNGNCWEIRFKLYNKNYTDFSFAKSIEYPLLMNETKMGMYTQIQESMGQ